MRSSFAPGCVATARGETITDWRGEKRSGKTLARPELDHLRADARAGHVRRLYVFKLDRLTRSGIRDTFEVIEELHAHAAELVSVHPSALRPPSTVVPPPSRPTPAPVSSRKRPLTPPRFRFHARHV